jgi:hypothetical protein
MAEFQRRSENEKIPAPPARRLTRPSWRDGRLITGVALVLVATLSGAVVLGHYDDSAEVLVAARDLVPGEKLAPKDLRVAKVRLGEGGEQYLSTGSGIPAGEVLRAVRVGELVPRTAVGPIGSTRDKTVAVPVTAGQEAPLQRGSVVDVWVSKATGHGDEVGEPQLLIPAVTVSQVSTEVGGLRVSSAGSVVQLRVGQERVAPLLSVINTGGKVNLVPVAGSTVRGS